MMFSQLSPVATVGPQLQRPSHRYRKDALFDLKMCSTRRIPPPIRVSEPSEGLRTCPTTRQLRPDPPPHNLQSKSFLSAGLVLAATTLMLASAPPSLARLDLPNKEVDDATSPLVQKLLKRTEENRERYKRERLQDYYRRNFKEYFEFEASSAKVARARGLSAESQEAIAKWLQENK